MRSQRLLTFDFARSGGGIAIEWSKRDEQVPTLDRWSEAALGLRTHCLAVNPGYNLDWTLRGDDGVLAATGDRGGVSSIPPGLYVWLKPVGFLVGRRHEEGSEGPRLLMRASCSGRASKR